MNIECYTLYSIQYALCCVFPCRYMKYIVLCTVYTVQCTVSSQEPFDDTRNTFQQQKNRLQSIGNTVLSPQRYIYFRLLLFRSLASCD